MSAEEKLSAILRAEADVIDASPAGWDRIREGIAVRRRRRLWLRSSVAAATALSLVAVIAVTTRGTDPEVRSVVVTTQPPTPSVEPSSALPVADENEPLPVVWPLTTRREIRFWTANPESRPALRTAETSVKEFVLRYLGLTDVQIRINDVAQGGSSEWSVSRLIVPAEERTRIFIATVSVIAGNVDENGPRAPYLVSRVDSGDGVESLTITSPRGDSPVRSPVTVTGAVTGVDESVLLEVRAHNPAGAAGFVALTKGFVPAGAEQPWETSLTFNDPPDAAGAIFATTASPADGQLSAVVAVPIVLAPGEQASTAPQPSTAPQADGYPAEFVAVERGRLAVFETKSGKRVRNLTEELPGGGVSDPSITPDGKSVVFVQGEGTCAASIRRVPVDGGSPEILVKSNGTSIPVNPVQSSINDLAYWEQFCQREGNRLVVQRFENGEVGNRRTINPGNDATLSAIAWSPDATTLAVVNSLTLDSPAELYLVKPGTHEMVEEGKKLPQPAEPKGEDCGWSGVGYGDDGALHAAQICHSEIADAGSTGGRLVEFEPSNPRVMLSTGDVIDWFDVDATGDHILLGTLACGETCEDADRSVRRFSIDGEPVPVADGLAQPVWVG